MDYFSYLILYLMFHNVVSLQISLTNITAFWEERCKQTVVIVTVDTERRCQSILGPHVRHWGDVVDLCRGVTSLSSSRSGLVTIPNICNAHLPVRFDRFWNFDQAQKEKMSVRVDIFYCHPNTKPHREDSINDFDMHQMFCYDQMPFRDNNCGPAPDGINCFVGSGISREQMEKVFIKSMMFHYNWESPSSPETLTPKNQPRKRKRFKQEKGNKGDVVIGAAVGGTVISVVLFSAAVGVAWCFRKKFGHRRVDRIVDEKDKLPHQLLENSKVEIGKPPLFTPTLPSIS